MGHGELTLSSNWRAGKQNGWRKVRGFTHSLGAGRHRHQHGLCSRQVTGGLSGSALMRNIDHAVSLIEATVQAARVPVTVKMRLGWDHGSLNAPTWREGRRMPVHG